MKITTNYEQPNSLTDDQAIQLLTGFDVFNNAWGDGDKSPEVLAEMRRLWNDNRERLLESEMIPNLNLLGIMPWGQFVFDKGNSPESYHEHLKIICHKKPPRFSKVSRPSPRGRSLYAETGQSTNQH